MKHTDLDQIEARAGAVPDGPWTLSDDLEGDGYPGHLWVVRTPASGPDEPDEYSAVVSIGDRALGEFIAHTREDVDAMAAEIRRLRTQVATETAQHAFTLRQRNNRSERLLHLRDLANAGNTEALLAAAKDTLAASRDDHNEGLSGPCDCGEGAVHYTSADCPAAHRAATSAAPPGRDHTHSNHQEQQRD